MIQVFVIDFFCKGVKTATQYHFALAGYSKQQSTIPLDAENAYYIKQEPCRIFNRNAYSDRYKEYYNLMPDFSKLHNTKAAGNASEENESQVSALAFQVLIYFLLPC
jgi:hypothetical protein